MVLLRRAFGFFAVLCLVLPAAMATDTGEFTVQELALPDARSAVHGSPLGLFGPQGDGLHNLTLEAERAHVIIREQRILSVTDEPLPSVYYVTHNDQQSYNLSPATLRLVDGGGDGYYGIYFDAGAADLAFNDTRGARLDARDRTVLGSAQPETGPATERPNYGQVFTTPHLGLLSAGAATLTGDATLKLTGPDILIGSGDNLRRINTGEETSPDEPNTIIRRWVLVDFENATLHLHTTEPVETLLPQAEARWDGAARLDRPQGSLATEDGTYVAHGNAATLNGLFRATLKHTSSGEGAAIHADVQGDLRNTTLAAEPQAETLAPFPGSANPDLALLASLAAVAGGSTLALLGARRHRARRLDDRLSHLVDAAHAAAHAGRPTDGLAHLDEALHLAPDRAHLRIDRGLLLMRLGHTEEAIAAFEEAAALDATGDADLLAASAASAAGLDPETIVALLARALTRDPALEADAAQDPHLAHHVTAAQHRREART